MTVILPVPLNNVKLIVTVILTILTISGCGSDIPVCPACVVSDLPTQVNVSNQPDIKVGDVALTPRATYQVVALVRGVKWYDWLVKDDMGDDIPVDLALAWGYSAQPDVAAQITIGQSYRFFSWRTHDDRQRSHLQELANSMANTHIIPGSEQVAKELKQVEPGQKYALEGVLVDVHPHNKPTIATSLIRNDSGAGACEIMLLRSIRLVSP